ncbi:MAG: DUF1893 domain-containing protein [Armatimonadetes bacterium]|nr:DUF1893 domain-containing protein [Armatimonadota bacterium]
MTRLETAIQRLREAGASLLIIVNSEVVFQSQEPGLRSLVGFLVQQPGGMAGATVIDKVAGAAVARLCVHGKARRVYSATGSEEARSVLHQAGVEFAAETWVPHILNKDRTEVCPMEMLSRQVEPCEFLESVRHKLGMV